MQVADKNRDVRTLVILGIVCLVLQLALAPNVSLANGHPNFALVFSACVALTKGGRRGVISGFVAGLLYDLSATSPIGLMAFCLTLTSFLLGAEGRDRMTGELASGVSLYAVSTLAVSLVYNLAMLLVGQADSIVDVLFLRALPSALLSLVAFLPFAYYFSRVRVSSSSLGGRPGHLSGRGL